MKRNAAAPYYIIGILGILAMIIMGGVGMAQMNNAEGEGEESAETTDLAPEDIYSNNCMSCHGGELEGGMGPDLTSVGDRYDASEIVEIIQNGKGQMPAINLDQSNAEKLAEWLVDGAGN